MLLMIPYVTRALLREGRTRTALRKGEAPWIAHGAAPTLERASALPSGTPHLPSYLRGEWPTNVSENGQEGRTNLSGALYHHRIRNRFSPPTAQARTFIALLKDAIALALREIINAIFKKSLAFDGFGILRNLKNLACRLCCWQFMDQKS